MLANDTIAGESPEQVGKVCLVSKTINQRVGIDLRDVAMQTH